MNDISNDYSRERFLNYSLSNYLYMVRLSDLNVEIKEIRSLISDYSSDNSDNYYVLYRKVYNNSGIILKEEVDSIFLYFCGSYYKMVYQSKRKTNILRKIKAITLGRDYMIYNTLLGIVIVTLNYLNIELIMFMVCLLSSVFVSLLICVNVKTPYDSLKRYFSESNRDTHATKYNKYSTIYFIIIQAIVILSIIIKFIKI
jgi:hypothetical protein